MTWLGFAPAYRLTTANRKNSEALRTALAWVSSSFLNLSTFGKALVGSGVSLLLLGLILLIDGHLLFGIDRTFTRYQNRTVVLETADAIERRFLDLRQEAQALALSGSDTSEAALAAALGNLNQAVETGRTTLSKPKHRQTIALLPQRLADYELRLRLSIRLRATQIAMTRDFLDDANEKMRASLYSIARLSGSNGTREAQLWALAGLETVLLAQLTAHDALARPTETGLQDAAQSLTGLRALVVEFNTQAADPLIKPMYDDLAIAAERFTDSFAILSSMARLVDDLNNRSMVAEAALIAETIEDLRRDALADASLISDTLAGQIRDARLTNIALGVLALTIGTLYAWLISGALAAPVAEMARAMRRLALGDKSVTPPALSRRDEIGEMAAAVAVIKAGMIEAEIEKQAIERANRRLEEKIAERTRELEQSRQESLDSLQRLTEVGAEIAAQQKLASLGRIVAGIAHEVNTPLGVAITACSSLAFFGEEFKRQVEARDFSQEDLTEFLSNMILASEMLSVNLGRAARLVSSFKQVSADQHTGEERRMLLGEHVRNIAASLEPEIRKLGHRLELSLDETVEATIPPDALWQVISNLVINALTHGLPNVRSGQISISLTRERKMAVVRVRDNGAGIAPHVQEHIFEPFFTTKRGRGGTGLGLSVVHTLATHTLGGRVTCKSALGEGTEFSLFFPLQSKPALAEA